MSDTCDNIGTYDFDCVLQNQRYDFDLTFTEGDPATPLDLTVYPAIRLDIKDDFGNVVVSLSLGDGLVVGGDDDNILTVSFERATTLVLTRPSYNYDILFVNSSGEHWYPLKGMFTIKNTITR